MASWFVSIALPLALYFGLVFLPKAGALRLLIVSGLALGAVWVAYYLKRADTSLDAVQDGLSLVLLLAFTVSLFLGGTMMMLKRRLPANWPAWSWPVCVILTLVAIGVPFLRVLGV